MFIWIISLLSMKRKVYAVKTFETSWKMLQNNCKPNLFSIKWKYLFLEMSSLNRWKESQYPCLSLFCFPAKLFRQSKLTNNFCNMHVFIKKWKPFVDKKKENILLCILSCRTWWKPLFLDIHVNNNNQILYKPLLLSLRFCYNYDSEM